jgi:short subunit dehydrogenase-like uncharacterized protein
MSGKWMIYGATGYTGQLVLDLALLKGMTPVVAGRNPHKVMELAQKRGLIGRFFDLNENSHHAFFEDIDLVLNCAGPFIDTYPNMIKACLAEKAHYLDVTGEFEVLDALMSRSTEFQKAGIVVLPGVGFDVVPTDLLAKKLKDALPDAETLTLAIKAKRFGVSKGTAKTMAGQLGGRGLVRRGGVLTTVPAGTPRQEFDFFGRSENAMGIPWGDVVTAFYSTGIPNITVFAAAPPSYSRVSRAMVPLKYILKVPPLARLWQGFVHSSVTSPTSEERKKNAMSVIGIAESPGGQRVAKKLITPDGYTLTAQTALGMVEFVLNSHDLKGGAYTPSQLVEFDFLHKVSTVELSEY